MGAGGTQVLPTLTKSEQVQFNRLVEQAIGKLAEEKAGLNRLQDHISGLQETLRKAKKQEGFKGLKVLLRDVRFVGIPAKRFRRYEQEVEEFITALFSLTTEREMGAVQLKHIKERLHIEAAQNLLDFSMYEGRVRQTLLQAQANIKRKNMGAVVKNVDEVVEILKQENEWIAAMDSNLQEARKLATDHAEFYWHDPQTIEATLEQLNGEKLHFYLMNVLTKPHIFSPAMVDAVERWLQKADLARPQLVEIGRVFEEVGKIEKAGDFYVRAEQYHLAADCFRRMSCWEKEAGCYLKLKQPHQAAQCLFEKGLFLQAAQVYESIGDDIRKARCLVAGGMAVKDEGAIKKGLKILEERKQYDLLAQCYYDLTSHRYSQKDIIRFCYMGFHFCKMALLHSRHEYLHEREIWHFSETLGLRFADRVIDHCPPGDLFPQFAEHWYDKLLEYLCFVAYKRHSINLLAGAKVEKFAEFFEVRGRWDLSYHLWKEIGDPNRKDEAVEKAHLKVNPKIADYPENFLLFPDDNQTYRQY